MPTAALHHMIVPVTDRDAAVDWFVDRLELREPWLNGFLSSVQVDDAVVLNSAPAPAVEPLHPAFSIGEEHVDRVRARFDRDGTP